jgi:4-amino-4-deoxy-L-arabinose transferase-like glycosyltransferase
MYAAIALVSWPFGGVSTWSARVPSALAATATVYLFFWYFRRQLGMLGGLVAAAILPACFMWLDKTTSAEIDMLQVFWVAASIVFFFRAQEDLGTTEEEVFSFSRKPQARGQPPRACGLRLNDYSLSFVFLLAALLCVAGGLLTKWTAPAFFYGTVVPLLWRRRRLRWLWGRQHLLAVSLAGGVCIVWFGLTVALTGWEVFSKTVAQEAGQHLLPRELPLAPSRHHHRAYPWHEAVAHPLVMGAASLPWSAFALLTLVPGFGRHWDDRGRLLLQALHCWTWPNLVFWSILPGNSPRHSFPLHPGLAGLAAMVWIGWLSGRLSWPLRSITPGQVLVGMFAAWLVVKAGFVHKDDVVQAVVPSAFYRDPLVKGQHLASLVPPGRTLYLFLLKDEGIMFYYSRAHAPGEADRLVRRLQGPEALSSIGGPVYCMVTQGEWEDWGLGTNSKVLACLPDQQGDVIRLVCLVPGLPQAVPERERTEQGSARRGIRTRKHHQ